MSSRLMCGRMALPKKIPSHHGGHAFALAHDAPDCRRYESTSPPFPRLLRWLMLLLYPLQRSSSSSTRAPRPSTRCTKPSRRSRPLASPLCVRRRAGRTLSALVASTTSHATSRPSYVCRSMACCLANADSTSLSCSRSRSLSAASMNRAMASTSSAHTQTVRVSRSSRCRILSRRAGCR